MDDLIHEQTFKWLTIAEGDRSSARTLLKARPVVGFSVCFHAQQCAEKALKAYLTFHDLHVERTHDLVKLVEQCSGIDIEFSNYSIIADDLTPFGVDIRYPDNYRKITLKEAKEAVVKAEQIYNFVKSKLDSVTLV